MSFLTDTNLRKQVAATPAQLLNNVDLSNLNQQIRGCAVDLRIGDIYRPGTDLNKPGSSSNPRQKYALLEGETAVIRTIESFRLDSKHAALVFPASSVSMQGLLMTNPGHVDPGYEGPLHVTVINMGREPYPLEKGGRFLRTLIFKFDEDVSTPSSLKDPKPINAELMERLSPDFLSVGARTSNAVKREIEASDRRTRFWQVFLPAIFALVASSLTLWYSNNSLSKEFTQRISDLEKVKVEGRLLALEKDFPTEKRLNVIEERLRQMETRPGSQVK